MRELLRVIDEAMRDGEAAIVVDAKDRAELAALIEDHERLKRLLDALLERQ